MNEFDKKQIEILSPFLEHNLILHFSFYANTFPIAYHYNLRLEEFNRLNSTSKKEISDFIKPHSWNEVFPSKSNWALYEMRKAMKNNNSWEYPESINLFYTSDIKYQTADFQKNNPLKILSETSPVKDGKEKIEPFLFSKYAPRFVFLNNNLYTQKLIQPGKEQSFTIDSTEFKRIENIRPQYYSLTEVLSSAKKDGIEKLCIYSETINEAKDIFEDYEDWRDKVIYYDDRKIDSLRLDDNSKNASKSLDIYFYGAPTSFLFLKRQKRFLPVLLDKANIAIETKAIIHSNFNNEKHSPAIINIVKECVKSYHENLYKVAASPFGDEYLNNIRLAYNKFARLTRNDSYFFTPESFTNCIALHNEYGEGETIKAKIGDAKIMSPTLNPSKNIHVHYGAGRLGIGLVLPLLKPNKSVSNQLIVIQKDRDGSEWSKKINLDSDGITLSNSIGWELNFELRKLTDDSFVISDNKDYFLLFENLVQIDETLKSATSISYSLGNLDSEVEFLRHLSGIQADTEILLFPFENKPFGSLKKDESKLDLIKNSLLPRRYIALKADRICANRNFNLGNHVKVSCENHFELVLNIDEKSTNHLFPITTGERNRHLIFADNPKRFAFLSKRKEYLVNELHFILVVYGYDFLISKEIVHWENQFVTIIQSALTSDPKYKIPIDTFIRLQITRLLYPEPHEYDLSILQREYNLNEADVELIYEHLMKYAKDTTDRFNASKEDPISRVFNTNDAKAIERKYNSIIRKIEDFINLPSNKIKIEGVQMLSAGTYLEYKVLIEDIKLRIGNILNAKIDDFKVQVSLKDKEQREKEYELDRFEKKINSLIKRD